MTCRLPIHEVISVYISQSHRVTVKDIQEEVRGVVVSLALKPWGIDV